MTPTHHTGSAELLIVGGGIGGLTTALTAARTGRPVRVLEQAAEFKEIGAGLQLAPNATRILDRLGLLPPIVDAGVLPRRLVFMDALSGGELTSLPLDDEFRQRYGGTYVVTHRSDLLDVLVDACAAADVALETGKRVTAARNHDDTVRVDCADGTSYTGLALVAADGVQSTLRAQLADDQPVCSGYVAYRGAIPIQNATRRADLGDVVAWIGPGMHLVQYPLRRGEIYNQVAVFRSRQYAAGQHDWGTPDELDATFSVACNHVREAIPTLWRDRRWPMSDREPIDNWTSGRITLLGDAAHPMLQYLAQGACQAIEDAATLTDALDTHLGNGDDLDDGDQVEKALRAYQDTRLPHTARVQRSARAWGDIWHVDGTAKLLRDELFRTRRLNDYRHVDWLYGEHGGLDERLPSHGTVARRLDGRSRHDYFEL